MSANSDTLSDKTYMPCRKFAVIMKCVCGQVGSAFWEQNMRQSPEGPMPVMLLEVSSGFYLLERIAASDPAEIMCAVCESVVLN